MYTWEGGMHAAWCSLTLVVSLLPMSSHTSFTCWFLCTLFMMLSCLLPSQHSLALFVGINIASGGCIRYMVLCKLVCFARYGSGMHAFFYDLWMMQFPFQLSHCLLNMSGTFDEGEILVDGELGIPIGQCISFNLVYICGRWQKGRLMMKVAVVPARMYWRSLKMVHRGKKKKKTTNAE